MRHQYRFSEGPTGELDRGLRPGHRHLNGQRAAGGQARVQVRMDIISTAGQFPRAFACVDVSKRQLIQESRWNACQMEAPVGPRLLGVSVCQAHPHASTAQPPRGGLGTDAIRCRAS